jgi:hypothetical protein
MLSLRFVVLAAGSLLFPAWVAAQTVSATTGAINGRVTDNTDAVLPGVTVTIASPSMMGTPNGRHIQGRAVSIPCRPAGHL